MMEKLQPVAVCPEEMFTGEKKESEPLTIADTKAKIASVVKLLSKESPINQRFHHRGWNMPKAIFFLTLIVTFSVFPLTLAAQGQPEKRNYCLDPSSWPKDQIDALKKRCDRMASLLEQRKKKEEAGKKWIADHGKSDRMTGIFKNHRNRIPSETLGEDEIKWVFELGYEESGKVQCRQYIFASNGELKESQESDCIQ